MALGPSNGGIRTISIEALTVTIDGPNREPLLTVTSRESGRYPLETAGLGARGVLFLKGRSLGFSTLAAAELGLIPQPQIERTEMKAARQMGMTEMAAAVYPTPRNRAERRRAAKKARRMV